MVERFAVNEDVAGSSPASPANFAPAFEVIEPHSGHRWIIHADGRVEGFGKSVVIINRIPLLMKAPRNA
jgi:hypothetical protein